MVLSQRERKIAIWAAAVGGLLFLNFVCVSPYLEARASVRTRLDKALADKKENDATFDRQNKLKKVWAEMKQAGLKSDSSQAESQVYHALLEWTAGSEVSVASLKQDRPVQQDDFLVTSFHVTASGPMSSVARLLWAMESATIPIRITEIQLNPRKEGTNDLSVQVSVSTLSYSPLPKKNAGGSAGGSTGGAV